MTHIDNLHALTEDYIDKQISVATEVAENKAVRAVAELGAAQSQLDTLTAKMSTIEQQLGDARTVIGNQEERMEGYREEVAFVTEQRDKAIRELEAYKAANPIVITPGTGVVHKDNGYPTVHYKDLALPGDDIDVALRRLTSKKNVILPAGLYEFSDFKYALEPTSGQAYGILAQNCMGLRCEGQVVIQQRPMTSTKASYVPAQGSQKTNNISVMRLGGETSDKVITWGLTLSMTEQGHLYNGWSHYRATGSHVYDCLITGGAGDWNAPPGETFMQNAYRDTDLTLERVETDGFIYVWSKNADGTLSKVKGRRTGGSPFGNNASINQKLIDCNFHDSYVSGLTSSFTGVPHSGSSPVGWTTRNVRLSRNANHVVGSGKTFSGINHEGTKGPIRHYSPHIDMLPNSVQSSHMSFGSAQEDNPDVEIHDPTWTTSPDWGNGCFSVHMADKYWNVNDKFDGINRWKTAPKVFIDGKQLIPVYWYDHQPKLTGLNPKTHFVIKR